MNSQTAIPSFPTETLPGTPTPADPPRPTAPFPRILRAMFFKESREAAIPAALALIATALVFANVLNTLFHRVRIVPDDSFGYGSYSDIALSDDFSAVTLILSPIAAAFLGFWQFFWETRADRFSFLTHRPVSRSRLFFAKSLTGLGLFLFALSLPTLFALYWISHPFNIPLPFTWSMGQIPLADILSGIPYYFAGILVARRTQARWHATRLFPLAAPFVFSLLVFISPNLLVAVFATLLGTLLTAIPARALFIRAGESQSLPRLAKSTLGLTLIASIMVVGAALLSLIDSLLLPTPSYPNYTYEYGRFLLDGTPVRVRQYSNGGQFEIRDLQGNRIDFGTDYSAMDAKVLSLSSLSPTIYPTRLAPFHNPWHYFSGSFTSPANVRWYPSAAGDYLVAYDPGARELVGALGASGFAKGQRTPLTRFPQRLIQVATLPDPLFASGDTLYRLSKFTLTPIFITPDHQHITAAGSIFKAKYSEQPQNIPGYPLVRRPMLPGVTIPVISTKDTLFILSSDPEPKVTTEFHQPDLDTFYLSIAQLESSHQYVLHLTPFHNPHPGASQAIFVNTDGSIARTLALSPDSYPTYNRSNFMYYNVLPAVASPTFLFGSGILEGLWQNRTFSVPVNNEFRRILRISLTSSVLLTLPAFLLARRRGNTPIAALGWSLIAFAFGPAGLLLQLCLSPWPVTTPCPSCRRKRPVNASLCPRCQAPFPKPAPTGTEIFNT